MGARDTSRDGWQANYASRVPNDQGGYTYGPVTHAPNYPDTSIGAYYKQTGKTLFGYNAWRDRLIADYNTAMAEYKNWYESTEQQMKRIEAGGLNPNLAYGMASPGGASNTPAGPASGPSPEQVIGVGAQVLGTVFGGIKTLAEAATIVAALPESQFKGRMYKLLDAGAASARINSENAYQGQLAGARAMLGVGTSTAQRESADNAYQTAKHNSDKQLLDYLTSHDEDGNSSDFESSIFSQAGTSKSLAQIVDYRKVSAEFHFLLSKPEYWQGLLDKTVSEGIISKADAWQVDRIMKDPNMTEEAKFLALQRGIPGFIAKLCFSIVSRGISDTQRVQDALSGFTFNPEINPTTPPGGHNR